MGSCREADRTPYSRRRIVGERIQQLREAGDLERSEVAEHVGVSVQHIRLIEQGRSGSSRQTVERILRPLVPDGELGEVLEDLYGAREVAR